VTVVPSRQQVRRGLEKTPFNAMLQNPLRIFWLFFVLVREGKFSDGVCVVRQGTPVRLAPPHILWT